MVWRHVRIRPEEPLSIEVDHVVRVFGDPDFGFPGDVGDEGLHGAAVLEGARQKPCPNFGRLILAVDKGHPVIGPLKLPVPSACW